VITDKFGCRLAVGDWVIYVPIDPSNGGALHYGCISRIVTSHSWPGGFDFIDIEGQEHSTKPSRCVKFSQEEYTMRKLESEK